MNQAHIHLMFNHFPIICSIVGFLILGAGYILKNETVKKTGLFVFMFAAVMCIPAYITGDSTEDQVKGLPGVSGSLIEQHEEIANFGMVLIETLGLLSLATFYFIFRNPGWGKILGIAVLILSFITSILMVQVGYTGGQIRHTEIRTGYAAPPHVEDKD